MNLSLIHISTLEQISPGDNTLVAGEAGINALVALAYGVPVVLVTGDATTASELRPFAPGARVVVVKESISRFAADSVHPHEARRMIFDAALEATASVRSAPPVMISLPATMAITCLLYTSSRSTIS